MTNNEFKDIDTATYVAWNNAQWAQKTAKVNAKFVPAGTVCEPVIMSDGHLETTKPKTAGADGGYVVTNPTGEVYLLERAIFERRYDMDNIGEGGTYTPLYEPVQVMQINENVQFQKYGGLMRIRSGGYLVKNPVTESVYGIQENEFGETFKIISGKGPAPAFRASFMPC